VSLSRRSFLGAVVCSPAIVRASSLMPIKPFDLGSGDLTAAMTGDTWAQKTAEEIYADIRSMLTCLRNRPLSGPVVSPKLLQRQMLLEPSMRRVNFSMKVN
jgi:hypothetical protein